MRAAGRVSVSLHLPAVGIRGLDCQSSLPETAGISRHCLSAELNYLLAAESLRLRGFLHPFSARSIDKDVRAMYSRFQP